MRYTDYLQKQKLTEEQIQACQSLHQATLVLAGAGTGKTSTLLGRVIYLIDCCGLEPDKILLLAFAREAANEMRNRVKTLLGEDIAQRLHIQTFHSLGFSLVRNSSEEKYQLTRFENTKLLTELIRDVLRDLLQKDEYRYHLALWVDFHALVTSQAGDWEQLLHIQTLPSEAPEIALLTVDQKYVCNVYELRVANALTLMGLAYHYRMIYEADITYQKGQPYRCSFYLPDRQIYIEVYPWEKANATQPQEQYQHWVRKQHTKYGTQLLELYASNAWCQMENPYWNILAKALNLALPEKMAMPPICQILCTEKAQHHLLTLCLKTLVAWRSRGFQVLSIYQAVSDPLLKGYCQLLHNLIEPIANILQQQMKDHHEISFEGMLAQGKEKILSGAFKVPWQAILIDEFQDLADTRYQLLDAIRQVSPKTNFFCVGDDWQSIYRFTGSDVRYVTEFERFFPNAVRYPLTQTFRFHQGIADIAQRFILKNPNQSQKFLRATRSAKSPCIFWVEECESLRDLLSFAIKNSSKEHVEILVLSRYSHCLPCESEQKKLVALFQAHHIEFKTVHAAKGQEADSVILLQVNSGENGFPAQKSNNPALSLLLPESEDYEHAEERRLFYVALTRAKESLYISYDPENPSCFIQEIQNNSKNKAFCRYWSW